MKNQTKHVVIDPGRRFVKAAWIDEEAIRTVLIPSVAGIGSTDIGQLSLGRAKEGPPAPRPYEVTTGGLSYVVGEGTRRYAHPTEGLYLLWSHDGPLVEALFYGALYHLLGPGEHRVALHVAMPMPITNPVGAFETWMVDRHAVEIDGNQVAFDVTDIKMHSGALGAFYTWGLDDDGEWKNQRTLRDDIAVLDVGYTGLRLSMIRGNEIFQQRLKNDAMAFLAGVIKGWLLQNYDLSKSLFEVDKLLYADPPQVHTANGPEDLSEIVSRVRHILNTDIELLIDQIHRMGFRHIILTGGGIQLLSPITDQQVHVLEEPLTALVRGLASYIARTDRRREQ